jgi:hypothetical protein
MSGILFCIGWLVFTTVALVAIDRREQRRGR